VVKVNKLKKLSALPSVVVQDDITETLAGKSRTRTTTTKEGKVEQEMVL
jgi:hypothetical protein